MTDADIRLRAAKKRVRQLEQEHAVLKLELRCRYARYRDEVERVYETRIDCLRKPERVRLSTSYRVVPNYPRAGDRPATGKLRPCDSSLTSQYTDRHRKSPDLRSGPWKKENEGLNDFDTVIITEIIISGVVSNAARILQ